MIQKTNTMSSGKKTGSILFRMLVLIGSSVFISAIVVMLVICPVLQNIFIANMKSKADSILLSINQVVGESIITESYSTAVEHCIKVVSERPLVEYIVVARNKGDLFVYTKQGWSMKDMKGNWQPDKGDCLYDGVFLHSEIIEDREVFHLSTILVYSGINAGWLHIGLSLDQYYLDLKSVIFEIAIVITGCMLSILSLLFFLIKKVVNPILLLKSSMEKMRGGDLSTRAEIKSGDEIELLADSFNDMAEDLSKVIKELEFNKANLEKIVDRRTAEAEGARKFAEDANMAKSEFLANMSHELRTPLHGIINYAGLSIEDREYSTQEDQIDSFRKIEKHGKMLLEVVNNILDLAKLESCKMIFDFRKEDIWSQVIQVADEFEPFVIKKNITIDCIEPQNKPNICIDRTKFSQVIRNLLSNAVKFSKKGCKIGVFFEEKEDFVKVTIKDDGIGIPEDELRHVFDKFVQSSKTKTGAGGTGLGLSICKEIVSAHKGKIWAENNPDAGAMFQFTIAKDLKNRKKLGELLIESGLISKQDLEKELKKQETLEEINKGDKNVC